MQGGRSVGDGSEQEAQETSNEKALRREGFSFQPDPINNGLGGLINVPRFASEDPDRPIRKPKATACWARASSPVVVAHCSLMTSEYQAPGDRLRRRRQ